MTRRSGSREATSAAEILSELAHDLRNFLEGLDQTVLARPELAEEPELRDVVHREILSLVLRTERHRDSLSVRPSSRESAREPVGLRPLCESTVRGLAAFLRKREVSIDVPESAAVSAERASLGRALANACYAACRSSAETAPLRFVASRDEAGSLSLVIEAEGCLGPPDAELGLEELDVYDRVLERRGGALHYEHIGPVLRITLRMPSSEPTERESEIRDVGTSGLSPGARVLVVDDNEDSARSLAVLLEIEGFQTEVRFDGRSALEAARSRAPDVVLLDLGLPDLDGFEVCESLREAETAKQPRIVAVSGFGDEDARRRMEEAGFDDHLLKPVDPGELRRVLGSPTRGTRRDRRARS